MLGTLRQRCLLGIPLIREPLQDVMNQACGIRGLGDEKNSTAQPHVDGQEKVHQRKTTAQQNTLPATPAYKTCALYSV